MTSTHIRIPIEVKSRLDAFTRTGESIGAVISRIMDYYESSGNVNEYVNTPVNNISTPINADVIALLTELSLRVSALEAGRQGEKPVNSHVNAPLTDIEEMPEVPARPIPTPRPIIPGHTVLPTSHELGNKVDEKMPITPELRQKIIIHLDELNAKGMIDARVTEAAGLKSRSLISLIRNGAQKSIKPEQYRALMSL